MKFLLGYFTCFFMVLWAYLVFGNMNRKNCVARTLLYMLAVVAAVIICFLSNFIGE